MKKTAVLFITILFMLTGCNSELEYLSRIEALESTVATQGARILELENKLSEKDQNTATPYIAAISTPEPTPTPIKSFLQYAQAGPEFVYGYLPQNFVHPFDVSAIEQAELSKSSNGQYIITISYTGKQLKESDFNAFIESISENPQKVEWSDNSGFVQYNEVSYHMYENTSERYTALNVMPEHPSLEFISIFESDLVDLEACVLPEMLTKQPDEITISFDNDYVSVDTSFIWRALDTDSAKAIEDHYKLLFMGKEWFTVDESNNGVGIYARLDDYRAIQVKLPIVDDGVDCQIVVYNFTVEKK